ncbi:MULTISPECIES: M14 family zinc carboxypeptidase [unclassified Agromyces]|uniref:M14 family zinc carboxypeptidase n=1 Tax=unclassified Agromyces TaxID=2639701 RepID=UPI0030158702
MSFHRTLAGVSVSAVVAATLVAGSAPAVALDGAPAVPIVTPVSSLVEPPASYPYQPELEVVPDDPTDASINRGVIPYDEIAPKLNELMEVSDRISVQVVGESALGRDIHLVTITGAENRGQTTKQAKFRELIKQNPAAAAKNRALMSQYKVPIWFNANIHGNEWEGTDAVLDYIEYLATAPEAEVDELLDGYRLYFTVTNNPDGRALGQRATADGFDANRDLITGATPEARLIRDLTGVIQPTFYVDLHGYTSVLQVEPCGPPHGENYEYDLFLPHAYSAALEIEQAVVDADIPGNTYLAADGSATTTNTGKIKIPYRDIRSGWDDWPPIFTPQYVAYQGAVTNTVELPLGRVNPPEDPRNAANSAVNIEVANVVVETSVDYVVDNRAALLSNQIEIFRRGAAGEPIETIPADVDPASVPEPNEWAEIWDETDVYPTEVPRAYVIPVGEGQRSTTDAARLVDQLIANGVEVHRAEAAFSAGGADHPAGSYVVDMHQPLRGMANVLLADGSDISTRVPDMYDISAWSLALLWGADVVAIGDTTDPALEVKLEEVAAAAPTGSVPPAGSYLELATGGVAEYQAITSLLESGVAVSAFEDGSVILGPDAASHAAAVEVADRYGVAFTASDGSRLAAEESRGLDAMRVAYSGGAEERVTLQRLGFDHLVPVSSAALESGAASMEGVDVLWIGGTLNFGTTQAAGRAKMQAYLDGGGGVVGEGTAIASFANAFKLVSSTAVSGTSGSNGIIDVDPVDGGLLGTYPMETSFGYPAVWFTNLGANAVVEQRYDADDPFVSGHWRDSAGRSQSDAAGQASAVSAETAAGSRVLMFGSSMNFRTHPVGLYGQIARGLFWAGSAGAEVPAP